MVILQIVWALLSKSVKKVFSTLFGWAVIALFGRAAAGESTYLSALVAGAILWPVVVLGVFAPRVATFVVSLVPLAKTVPEEPLRAAWLVLALALPLLIGFVLSRRAGPAARTEGPLVRLLRGFPVTLGVAAAFLVALVTVPIRKLRAFATKTCDDFLGIVVEPGKYEAVADDVESALRRHGFALMPKAAEWSSQAPSAILRVLGGPAFRQAVPKDLRNWEGSGLHVALEPNGVALSGTGTLATRARGILTEALLGSPVLQTSSPRPQALERRLRSDWRALQTSPQRSALIGAAANQLLVSRQLLATPMPYADWEILYRQALQISRAVHRQLPLLQSAAPNEN